MIYLISPEKKQYKANLHCHSILSDGKKTPEELKRDYKKNGYSILAITDHERPCNHQELCEKDFLLLTGYEAYIRSGEAVFGSYKPEIHMNLFAKDPENVKMIAFDKRYARYLERDNVLDALEYVGEPVEREYSVPFINSFLRTATENGYLVSYNHACWSMETEADVLAYDGFFSMEMFNYSSYLINGLEYNGNLYDKMLRLGKRIYCHATDDNHNKFADGDPASDSYGGFTMIYPEAFTYGSVMEAMEKGEMYSSTGPVIRSLAVEEDRILVECSEAKSIYVSFGGKKFVHLHASPDQPMTSAEIEIPSKARYARVTVVGLDGNRADTRGYFRDELGLAPLAPEEM